MSLKYEIFRYFFILFGLAQSILNIIYLISNRGLHLARKQHQELPKNLSDRQITTKILCMMIFGILFLITGLLQYFMNSMLYFPALLILFSFSIYASIEAFYYKYWRTIGFAIMAITLSIVFMIR